MRREVAYGAKGRDYRDRPLKEKASLSEGRIRALVGLAVFLRRREEREASSVAD